MLKSVQRYVRFRKQKEKAVMVWVCLRVSNRRSCEKPASSPNSSCRSVLAPPKKTKQGHLECGVPHIALSEVVFQVLPNAWLLWCVCVCVCVCECVCVCVSE